MSTWTFLNVIVQIVGFSLISTIVADQETSQFCTKKESTVCPTTMLNEKIFTLGIMMFDNVELLDFAGPFDVFGHAAQMFGRFKVLTIGHKKQIGAGYGLNVIVDYVIGDPNMPKLDIVVVPGGSVDVTVAALNHPVFVPWLKKIAEDAEYIISVCTGVNFLCRADLADGLYLTTHHQLFDLAEKECPRSKMAQKGQRFTDNGRIFTSAGISAGIDVSLYFIKKVIGRNEANQVAERMEYDWKDYDYDQSTGVIVSG